MTPETEDELRQYFRDATATVDGRPDLVGDVVHAGKRRLRRRRSAVVGAAAAATLAIALVVPIIQSANDPGQRDSSPAATATTQPLPQIATWPRPTGKVPVAYPGALLEATLQLSSDGQCLVAGGREPSASDKLLVWPPGYSVALRDGHVRVLDESGAEAARVGDHFSAGGAADQSPVNGVPWTHRGRTVHPPANACGLSSAFYINPGSINPGRVKRPR
jgi:hypothetical protein